VICTGEYTRPGEIALRRAPHKAGFAMVVSDFECVNRRCSELSEDGGLGLKHREERSSLFVSRELVVSTVSSITYLNKARQALLPLSGLL
jgi:hypothetical protein